MCHHVNVPMNVLLSVHVCSFSRTILSKGKEIENKNLSVAFTQIRDLASFMDLQPETNIYF